jgi:phosphomannomutase
MPEISRFFGIIIAMYFGDHQPPHFHARYGGYRVTIKIRDLSILDGYFPPRALGLMMEWAAMHQNELARNWDLAQNNQPLMKINPLE